MKKYTKIEKPHLKMPKINNFYICVELMRKARVSSFSFLNNTRWRLLGQGIQKITIL